MVSVQTIVRRLPHGWETLLEVNGVIGRAEEVLCLEEKPAPPKPIANEKLRVLRSRPERCIDVTVRPAEFANSVEM